MAYRVIEPGPARMTRGYVLPGDEADGAGSAAAGAGAVALPRGADGRVAQAGVPVSRVEMAGGTGTGTGMATGMAMAVQPAWGWGLAPAAPAAGMNAGDVLACLPADPELYTARQQNAVRRDLAAGVGDYETYGYGQRTRD